jgi:hypothetical protein
MRAESSNIGAIQKTIRILGICLLVGILIYFLTRNAAGISLAVKDDHLSLSYSSGDSFSISFKDILSVTEIQILDLGQYVSGTQTKYARFGVWKNGEFGEYKLCIYAGVEHFLVVKTSSEVFVFNLESVNATDSFYKAFLDLLQSRQVHATQ